MTVKPRLQNPQNKPKTNYSSFLFGSPFFFLSLAPQPSLGHGLLHKIQLNFLEASQQFSFLQGRVVIPTPNPHPEGPGLYLYPSEAGWLPILVASYDTHGLRWDYSYSPTFLQKSRDSSVGIALGYGLDDRGSRVRFPAFSSPPRPERLWGPSSLLSNGYQGLFLGEKRPGVKLTTHLHLVPRTKNVWSYTSTPQYTFMAWGSVERSTGTPLPSSFSKQILYQ
jgi:hypothetical protein